MTVADRILEALRAAEGPMPTAAVCRALRSVPVHVVLRELDVLWERGEVDGGYPSPEGPWSLPRRAEVQMSLGEMSAGAGIVPANRCPGGAANTPGRGPSREGGQP